MASETQGFQEGVDACGNRTGYIDRKNSIKKGSWKGNLKLKKWHSRNPTQNQGPYTQSYKRAQGNSNFHKLLQ